MTTPKKGSKAAKPEAETAPEPEVKKTPVGLFIPDEVREDLAKPRVLIDKTKEGVKVLIPFMPADLEERERCLEEGVLFEGTALWISVYLQPLTDGGMLINNGTALQLVGTREQCIQHGDEPIEALAFCGGAGGGINGPALRFAFGHPYSIKVLTEAGVPLEGEFGLKAQFANTSAVQKLRTQLREWRQSLAQTRRGGGGGQVPYTRPTQPTVSGPAGDRIAGDFKFADEPESE